MLLVNFLDTNVYKKTGEFFKIMGMCIVLQNCIVYVIYFFFTLTHVSCYLLLVVMLLLFLYVGFKVMK